MSLAYVFSFGFLASILEIHLHGFGLGTLYVALCFMLQSTVYVVISLSGGYLFKGIDERLLMLIGEGFFVIAFLMLGPWQVVFPKSLWVVIVSLPLFSVGQSLTYSKAYLVFSIPFMINSAVNTYGYSEDDILTDVISAFSVLGQATGEVIGPIFAGSISEYFGIEACCVFASVLSLGFFFVFFFASGYFSDLLRRKGMKKSSLLINTKVAPHS
jgi:MFS family permease